MDDVVIYDCDKAQHTLHVRQFLQRCAERGITLNRDKWSYTQSNVQFAGFVPSAGGYQVDGSITDAISTPATRSELRSFVGLVNQLSASIPAVATSAEPPAPPIKHKE